MKKVFLFLAASLLCLGSFAQNAEMSRHHHRMHSRGRHGHHMNRGHRLRHEKRDHDKMNDGGNHRDHHNDKNMPQGNQHH